MLGALGLGGKHASMRHQTLKTLILKRFRGLGFRAEPKILSPKSQDPEPKRAEWRKGMQRVHSLRSGI